MKVKGIKSLLSISKPTTALLLVTLTTLLPAPARAVGARLAEDADRQADGAKPKGRDKKDAGDKPYREAKKALREGKYEKAIKIYRELLDANDKDLQASLGGAFAYLKLQAYALSFDLATEALKLDPRNARGHAIAGLALLRSGLIRPAVIELNQSVGINPKESLAFGGAAEIDYYEGRIKESRAKAFYAHTLEPTEPDYIITYARASSRLEDFKEAADAYEIYLDVAPETDSERRARIKGLIQFYRQLQGLQVHQLAGASTTAVPFRLGSDRRPYIKVKVNGREANFVVDTGSGFTVISMDTAKQFGVSEIAHGGNSQGVGGDGKFPIVYGLLKSLQIGDVRVRMVPCFIRPFHTTKDRPDDEYADGFIGLSILAHFLTELDYKDQVIRLDRSTDKPLPVADTPDVTVVPFRTTQNGLISIETEFDDRNPINAILDSGASSTVISMAAVERLNMRDQIIKGQTANVIGAAGVTSNVEMLFIRNCKVANLNQSNLRALVLDFGAINETSGFEQSGILGGDFLRHFRVTIDFSRAQVALRPHTSSIIRQ